MSDADGEMKVTEVATKPLVQDLLNHEVNWSNIKVTYTIYYDHIKLGADATIKLHMVVHLVCFPIPVLLKVLDTTV